MTDLTPPGGDKRYSLPVPSLDKGGGFVVGRVSSSKKPRQNQMVMDNQANSDAARASPGSDAHNLRPRCVRNEQGLPGQGRSRLKKRVHRRKERELRVGTINIGTLNGKSREIADLVDRRKVDILCLQETRWKGKKSRDLAGGHKLIYYGESGRNGVAIVLSAAIREQLVMVSRKSERVIRAHVRDGKTSMHIISAYAPQVGCDEEEKERFWKDLEEEIVAVPEEDKVIIGGDLNGHVGKEKHGIERWHGGWSVGERNAEGQRILDFATEQDMALLNTFFKKEENQLTTYRSGGRSSQIDFLACRRKDIRDIKDCRVINGEEVAAQHRLVLAKMKVREEKRGREEKERKIKWWKLKEPEAKRQFREKVLEEWTEADTVEEWWRANSGVMKRAGEETLGRTSGKSAPADKETWWWNEEVQRSVSKKKELKKKWDTSGSQEDRERYKEAKREAKRTVAIAKDQAWNELFGEMETPEGEKKLFKLAKKRDKASKDLTQIKQMKDDQGVVLTEKDHIVERWKTYFEKLLNEENPRSLFGDGQQNHGVVREVTRSEVERALKKMKNAKATGPDGIPVEAWKSLGEFGAEQLTVLMRKIWTEEEIPSEWRKSVITPIYKEKGDIQDCGNYRGIKLMSHTMKIWEKIIDQRLREETEIGKEQFGFMPGRSTTDAIFALKMTMEKHREKQKGLHLVFIDLEKAYDRVPRQEVWRCMRERGVPEKYVRLVQDMYHDVKTCVRSSMGETASFAVKVGLHQGSALSPYLFDLIMDVLSEEVKEEAPWSMMFADDIVLCDVERTKVEEKLETWRKVMEERGLKVSRKKTEYMEFNEESEGSIKMQDYQLKKVTSFKYLGTTLSENGELEDEVEKRIQSGWNNWKKLSGVLCDKRLSAGKKGKVFKAAVRPAMTYGSETWGIKKAQEKKMDVAEMKMLRWACGHTRLDHIENEEIRRRVRVTEVHKKIQEKRLRWYGHVKRRDEDHVTRRTLEMELGGRRARGRPKRRWMDCVLEDMAQKRLRRRDVADRRRWNEVTRNSDPT